jgi:hypothetical protein
VSADHATTEYLRAIRTRLDVPSRERRRALEEIGAHLEDSRAAHVADGASEHDATKLAIAELGPPEAVAANFNAGVDVRTSMATRWLPMMPSLVLLVPSVVLLLWSVTWLDDGWTSGERLAQRGYLFGVVVAALLGAGTYVAIRRAEVRHTPRTAAWLFSASAVALLGISLFR